MLSVFAVAPALADFLDVSRRRDDRRLRQVEQDPRLATSRDVEMLVLAHGVPELQARSVVDRLGGGGIAPDVAWRWTMGYDGTELASLCASRLTDHELATVLAGDDQWTIAG